MNHLVPVPLHDDTLWADAIDPAHPVAVKPICEALRIDWIGQLQRIKRDAILHEGMCVINIPSPGGPQETVCLPLALIPGFLFSIDDRRIKDAAKREKVLRYKCECHAALYAHFLGGPGAGRDDGGANGQDGASPRPLLPGHPDFGEAVSLVREARLSMGKAAALAIWRGIGLPWTVELDQPTAPEADGDPVAIFARKAIERAPGVVTPSGALYPAFVDFCRRRSLHDAGAASFHARFARMGFSRTKTRGVRVYRNIRIRMEQEEAR